MTTTSTHARTVPEKSSTPDPSSSSSSSLSHPHGVAGDHSHSHARPMSNMRRSSSSSLIDITGTAEEKQSLLHKPLASSSLTSTKVKHSSVGQKKGSLNMKRKDDVANSLTPGKKLKPAKPRSGVQIVALTIGWYCSSVLSAYFTKRAIIDIQSSVVITFLAQLQCVIFGSFIIRTFTPSEFVVLSRRQIFRLIFPLGFCWTAVSIFYNSALRFIHVSFLNTMKSSIPFWTCLICRVYFKEEFSTLTYFSLAPILGGVLIACMSESHFNVIGLTCAMLSAIFNTLFNITANRTMKRLPQLVTHWYTSMSVMILTGLVWLVSHPEPLEALSLNTLLQTDRKLFFLIFAVGLVYYGESMLGYVIISSVSSLTFSIADVVRRLVIIIASVIMFHNEISTMNAFGIGVVMLGALIYNLSRNEQALEMIEGVRQRILRRIAMNIKEKDDVASNKPVHV